MIRFLHTSDLHVGKRFGQYPIDLRGRLIEARHQAIETLRNVAHMHEASFILVAGDFFDTGTPTPGVIRQALRAMANDKSLKWILLPGNHDSTEWDQLWTKVASEKSTNVVLALKNEPIEVEPSTFVLPAPCVNRRPGKDLTEWMDTVSTSSDAIRIGLAHGAIQSFGEEGGLDVIAPNRAELSNLDYLALGDWHGQLEYNPRSWYSGTPEPDRFKHDVPGSALVVTIQGHGSLPIVKSVKTSLFEWKTKALSVLPNADLLRQISAILPELANRRDTLLRLVLDGRMRLAERLLLEKITKDVEPDFAWMEINSEQLTNEYAVDDLDRIDRAGVLRSAADALYKEIQENEPGSSAAATALSMLYSFASDEP